MVKHHLRHRGDVQEVIEEQRTVRSVLARMSPFSFFCFRASGGILQSYAMEGGGKGNSASRERLA